MSMKEFFNNRYSNAVTNVDTDNNIAIRESQPKPALKQKLAGPDQKFQESPFAIAENKEVENLLESPYFKTVVKTQEKKLEIEVETLDSPDH